MLGPYWALASYLCWIHTASGYWVDVRPILRGQGGGLWVQIMENEFKCLTDKGVSKVVILVTSL